VTEQDWKAVVGALLPASNSVIVRVGATPGLQWELSAIRHEAIIHKAILFFCNIDGMPFGNGKLLNTMEDLKLKILEKSIPDQAYFCAFSDDGRPVFLTGPWGPDHNPYLRLHEGCKALLKFLQENRQALVGTRR
jgi:hypothetical protein